MSTKSSHDHPVTVGNCAHLIEPVSGGGELAPVEDHADGEVGVVQVEVEGDGPHDDQPRVQVLHLPRHRPARTRRRTALKR